MSKCSQSNRLLLNGDRLFAAILGTIPIPAFLVDREGNILFRNDEFRNAFGFTDDELRTESDWWILAYPDDQHRRKARQAWNRNVEYTIRKDARPNLHEGLITCKDGSKKLVEFSTAIIDEYVLTIFRDITERDLAEIELRSANDRLSALIDSSPLAIIAIDANGNVTEWSPAAEALFGWRKEEAMGRCLPYVSEENREEHKALRQRVLSGEGFVNVEVRCMRRDGSPVDISVSAVPMRDQPGNVVGIMNINADITERKKAEEALLFTQHAVDNAHDSIIHVGQDGRVLYANKAASSLLEYSNEELLNLHLWDFVPGYTSEQWSKLWEARRGFGSNMFEIRNRTKTGRMVDLEVKVSIVKHGDNEVQVSFARDISERKRAEQALLERTEELDRVFSLSLDLLCIADTNGYFLRLNPAWEQILDYQTDELEGRRFLDLVHPDDIEPTLKAVADLASGKDVIDFTNRYRHQDGSYRWIEWRSTPYQEKLIYAAARDVTERKQAVDALKESEHRYRSLIESMNEGFATVDKKNVFTYVNARFCEMLGYEPGEMVGHHLNEFLTEENQSLQRAHSAERLAGLGGHYELAWTAKDGHQVHALVSPQPLLSSEDEFMGSFATLTDISDRKKVEEDLARSNEELTVLNRLISETTADTNPIAILDMALDEALKIAGVEGGTVCLIEPDEILSLVTQKGTSEETVTELQNGIIRIGDCLCGSCARDGKPLILWNKEQIHNFPTRETLRGEDIRFHAAFPLMVETRCLGVLCVFTSTDYVPSERSLKLLETATMQIAMAVERARLFEEVTRNAEELEQRVEDRTAQLENANKELGAFSYSVSHDLRAPLRAIDGFSMIVLEDYADKLDKQGKLYLNRIRSAAVRMGMLIDDILRLSRVTRAEIVRGPANLSDMVKLAISELRERHPERDVEAIIEPAIIVDADVNLIRIAIENLIDNAWKFTSRKKTARIEFGVARELGDETYFVKDNGAGFESARAEKLFGAFQRLHSDSEFNGTGIGLATVRRIIHGHGGEVWAEGKVGKGATFYFTLKGTEQHASNNDSTG